MGIRNVIFDLDGTLLNTLVDIKDAINDALKCCHVPLSYSFEEAKSLIGDGADTLVHRSLRDLDSPDLFNAVKNAYMPLYRLYQNRHTLPFDGIPSMLHSLHGMGLKLFVASNKPDSLAKAIVSSKLDSCLFNEVFGHREGEPVKPNPILVQQIFFTDQISPKETLYCGDSHVDVETAHNAGIPVALCLWGYGKYDSCLLDKAEFLLKQPSDLVCLLKRGPSTHEKGN